MTPTAAAAYHLIPGFMRSGAEARPAVVGVVPARFASSRFPGKPLATIAGEPMIAHVVRRARAARLLDEVWVATDHDGIAAAAAAAGARVVRTPSDLPSGSDRVAWALRREGASADVVLNLQGDEPLLDAESVDRLASALLEDGKLDAATLAWPLADADEWRRPDVVKVVVAEDGRALYFSRAPLPHRPSAAEGVPAGALKHIGLYAFRRPLLDRFVGWPPTPLERAERLEQLRLLERGVRVQVVRAARDSIAVDRPEDVARVEAALGGAGGGEGDGEKGGPGASAPPPGPGRRRT